MFQASFPSATSLSGCARAAGASRGFLRFSRLGSARLVFVFPSSSWASRFFSVISGHSWVGLVAGVACRGCVVVVRVWQSSLPGSSYPLL